MNLVFMKGFKTYSKIMTERHEEHLKSYII